MIWKKSHHKNITHLDRKNPQLWYTAPLFTVLFNSREINMLNKTMPRIFSKIFIATATFLTIQTGFANQVIAVPVQPQPVVTATPPTLDAKGYVLMDGLSGKVLVEKNADERMAPASLTKLMSMYIVSGALKSGAIHLDDKVIVSKKAWQTGGSRMFIKVNDEVPVRELIQGIVVASGNDATVAMAEYVAGSEESFSSMMNTAAQALGMKNSHFTDSNGLPNADHYSTPRDLAILARAIIKDYPEDYKLYSEKWFTYNGIRQPNRNRLLWRYQYSDGLKTGHTDDAGYCLVSSAMKDGTRLIAVVMGAPNDTARTEDSIRLLTYGFRFHETHKLYNGNTPLTQARIWKGTKKELALGVKEDFYVTTPPGQYKNIQVNLQLNNPITAPIVKGQACGTINVTLNNQVIDSQPLVALADDPRGGLFRRMTDAVNYSFHKIFTRSIEKADNA